MHDGRVNGTLNLSRALGDMEFKRGAQLPPAEQVLTDAHFAGLILMSALALLP